MSLDEMNRLVNHLSNVRLVPLKRDVFAAFLYVEIKYFGLRKNKFKNFKWKQVQCSFLTSNTLMHVCMCATTVSVK